MLNIFNDLFSITLQLFSSNEIILTTFTIGLVITLFNFTFKLLLAPIMKYL